MSNANQFNDFRQGIEKLLQTAGLDRKVKIEIKGLYIASDRTAERIERVKLVDEDGLLLGVERLDEPSGSRCIADILYNGVSGQIYFPIELTGDTHQEYEKTKELFCRMIQEANQEGFNIHYDPNEAGYRQQFMEMVEKGQFHHVTLGSKPISEATAKFLIEQYRKAKKEVLNMTSEEIHERNLRELEKAFSH